MQKFTKIQILLFSILLIFILAFLDHLTGLEFGFSIFYLGPILLATWFHSKKAGIILSIISAVFWFSNDIWPVMHYSRWFFPVWNTFLRLGFFLFVCVILYRLKIAYEKEQQISQIDALTELFNTRAFYNIAKKEIQRSKRYRHPMSICYIDLDNFKTINDTFGHLTGNAVLKAVSKGIKQNVRSQDVCGRLGGDEFVVLLPETDDSSIKGATNKLYSKLIESMKREKWNVTFSIGAVTFINSPETVDDLIKKADTLMYKAKGEGKNRIIFDSIN